MTRLSLSLGYGYGHGLVRGHGYDLDVGLSPFPPLTMLFITIATLIHLPPYFVPFS